MPHYNEIFIEKTTRKKTTTTKKQKQNFTSKIQYLILKAPSNDVSLQLHKTLTTQN